MPAGALYRELSGARVSAQRAAACSSWTAPKPNRLTSSAALTRSSMRCAKRTQWRTLATSVRSCRLLRFAADLLDIIAEGLEGHNDALVPMAEFETLRRMLTKRSAYSGRR